MAAPPRVPITDERVKELIGNRKVLDPPTTRLSWTNSRLVVCDDGSTMPVLQIIAEAHEPWDPSEFYPVWADKDWTNESFDNTKLIRKAAHRTKRSNNKSGFPAGTPEYFQWYRAQHKDRNKVYNANARDRRRAREAEILRMKVEIEELKAREALRETSTLPSLDSLDDYKTQHLGGGSSPLVHPPIQIGTPMEDEPYNFPGPAGQQEDK